MAVQMSRPLLDKFMCEFASFMENWQHLTENSDEFNSLLRELSNKSLSKADDLKEEWERRDHSEKDLINYEGTRFGLAYTYAYDSRMPVVPNGETLEIMDDIKSKRYAEEDKIKQLAKNAGVTLSDSGSSYSEVKAAEMKKMRDEQYQRLMDNWDELFPL